LHADRRGVVHVIGPELGFTQPGMTIVCGDSHTATHGAFGALAFASAPVKWSMFRHPNAVADQSQNHEVEINGSLAKGVCAKDIILALISRIGVAAPPVLSSNTLETRYPD
jgi:3-isopropylmalate/(R)-2-methylmalate dehydratase large subunit